MPVVSDEFLAAVEGLAESIRQEGLRLRNSDFIRKTAGVCGGSARIRETRVAVWTVIGLLRLGRTEIELLADYPSLTTTDLDAAWTYYRAHTTEIDAEIAEEEREE